MRDEGGGARGLAFFLLLESVAAVFWAVGVALAVADRRLMDRMRMRRSDHAGVADEPHPPSCTIIVPARNEASNIKAWLDCARAQRSRSLSIVVVDDDSSDETFEIAKDSAGDDSRVKILRSPPLPAGWTGKNWAAHIGSCSAGGEWLLFSDADARMSPDSISLALHTALRESADGLSVTAHIECGTCIEWIVMPVMAGLIFSAYPASFVNDDRLPTGLMWGGFMLVRRCAYELIGGHAAIRQEIAEDRALAQRLKAFGFRVRLLNGSSFVRVRMYGGFAEMWAGWRKNLYEGVYRSPLFAASFIAVNFAMLVLPLPLLTYLGMQRLARSLRKPERWLASLALFGCGAALATRLLRDPTIGADSRSVVATPVAGLFVCAVMAASAWRILSGGGQTWKDRTIH